MKHRRSYYGSNGIVILYKEQKGFSVYVEKWVKDKIKYFSFKFFNEVKAKNFYKRKSLEVY